MEVGVGGSISFIQISQLASASIQIRYSVPEAIFNFSLPAEISSLNGSLYVYAKLILTFSLPIISWDGLKIRAEWPQPLEMRWSGSDWGKLFNGVVNTNYSYFEHNEIPEPGEPSEPPEPGEPDVR